MSILDTRSRDTAFTGVFVQTNEGGTNRVLAFRRGADGVLEQAGEYSTAAPAWARRTWVRRDR